MVAQSSLTLLSPFTKESSALPSTCEVDQFFCPLRGQTMKNTKRSPVCAYWNVDYAAFRSCCCCGVLTLLLLDDPIATCCCSITSVCQGYKGPVLGDSGCNSKRVRTTGPFVIPPRRRCRGFHSAAVKRRAPHFAVFVCITFKSQMVAQSPLTLLSPFTKESSALPSTCEVGQFFCSVME